MDAILMARAQFALNISFHVMFPTISIGLAWFLLYMRRQADRHPSGPWEEEYHFWLKCFALTFAFGVVSGVTMSFQFGTNWPGFMNKVGAVAGPLLAYEVLSAFFLEATFLGIMLFGQSRVSPRLYRFSVFLVAFGTTLSLFWILALNSWMHTPAGFELVDGKVVAKDWFAIIFNPSMPYRTVHMMLASGLTASFFIMGISAYRILAGHANEGMHNALRLATTVAAILIPMQMFAGDMHGLNTHEHQPAKIAAMEGIWQTERGVPLLLFAIPDEASRSNKLELGIPKLTSLIITHHFDGEIQGLNEFPNATPPVLPIFWSFRVMVGSGVLMLLLSWTSYFFYRRRGQLPSWFLKILVPATFLGWVPTLAGWYVTEMGRQPFLVSGVLRTADAVGSVSSAKVSSSLAAYVLLYAALLLVYITTIFYIARTNGKNHEHNAVSNLPADAT